MTFAQERVMVIADPHVLASSLVEEGAAMDKMMAGQRKMLDLSEVAFTALVDTALLHKPALVLIPGDLTKDSEVASHDVVAEQLSRLQSAGINTLVIPGNHDIGGKAFAYRGGESVPVESLSDSEWENKYAMVYEQALAKDPNSHSYVAEPLRGVTVLGIDASHEDGEGYLSDETLAWVLAQADEANAKGNMILAMCHWQVLEHVDDGGMITDISARLQAADTIRDELMAHGVHMLLTGHVHVNSISTYRDTIAVIGDSIVEISTGSPITYPCPYRWLTIASDRSTVEVSTAMLSALPEQDDLTTYSREWMKEHIEIMTPSLLVRLYDKAASVMEKRVEDMLKNVPMGSMLISAFKKSLPQTDEEKYALVNKHLASTIVDLYLLHSIANEPQHAEADSLAQAMYAGIGAMIHELTDAVLKSFVALQEEMITNIQNANRPAIQSLVEDRTHWASQYSDLTDDLTGQWFINEPLPETPVENVTDSEEDGAIYDLLGRRVTEPHYRGVYIQNGKKIIK
ncbi:MAG: metallophosphoesterase [Paludibacteraceae bacterium]|nr:metallophosphoesterase [Paludibacteraceae bacterium]